MKALSEMKVINNCVKRRNNHTHTHISNRHRYYIKFGKREKKEEVGSIKFLIIKMFNLCLRYFFII